MSSDWEGYPEIAKAHAERDAILARVGPGHKVETCNCRGCGVRRRELAALGG